MSSANRIIRVLEHVARAPSPPTQSEIAAAVGIPRSTVSDIVSDLRALGYVEIVDRRYVPGPALLSLGYVVTAEERIRPRLHPTLEAIAGDTGATTMLTIGMSSAAEELRVFVIDAVQGNEIRYVPELGPRPLYPTAAGRVFLAFSGRSAASLPASSLVRLTPRTVIDPNAIDEDFARIRARGYAISDGEARPDVAAIAAPVFDSAENVIAAVTVVVPSARMKQLQSRLWSVLEARLAAL